MTASAGGYATIKAFEVNKTSHHILNLIKNQ
jgi:hypothetical protein